MLRLDLNIVWTVINLLIIYAIIRIFLFKPVNKILAARQAEIDRQFSDAQSAQDAAAELKKQYEDSMSGMAQEKTAVINEARGRAGEEYERIVADAHAQADKILADARTLADREQEKRMQQAQEEIADLVVAATAKIVASKTSAEEDRELYNQFLGKAAGQRRSEGKCD